MDAIEPEPVEDIYEARAVILAQHNRIKRLTGMLSVNNWFMQVQNDKIEALTAMLSLRVQSLKIRRYEQTLKTIAKALHRSQKHFTKE